MKQILLPLVIGFVLLGCNQPLGNSGSGDEGEAPAAPNPPEGMQQLDTIDDGVSSGFGEGLAMSASFAAVSDIYDTSPANGRRVVHIHVPIPPEDNLLFEDAPLKETPFLQAMMGRPLYSVDAPPEALG